MKLENLSKILEKVYNTLGNKYLTDNFETGPFEFEVNIRIGGNDDLWDYIVQVKPTPELPRSFTYKPEVKEKNKIWADGIDISVLRNEFKSYIKYIDSSFGKFGKTVGVVFVN